MGRKNKLWKFEQLGTLPNVFENFKEQEPEKVMHLMKEITIKEEWPTSVFRDSKPVVMELACGKGEYTTGMAALDMSSNYLGVDIKGARIFKGAKRAIDQNLMNVAFLRSRIELLGQFIPSKSISEIWITFPDPFLKESKSNRRLTYYRFLDLYKEILINGGKVHLKTDSPELYQFSLGSLEKYGIVPEIVNEDIYSGTLPDPRLEIKTYYEGMHLKEGKKIRYLRFGF